MGCYAFVSDGSWVSNKVHWNQRWNATLPCRHHSDTATHSTSQKHRDLPCFAV